MPFDFTPEQIEAFERLKPQSRQAVVLDRIIEYLRDGENWTVGQLRRGDAFCLVGAVRNFTHFFERRAMFDTIYQALPDYYKPEPPISKKGRIASFNDSSSHAAVMATLQRARASVG